MFAWWAGLKPAAKYGVALLFCGLAVVLWYTGAPFRATALCGAVGIVLLCAATWITDTGDYNF
jgi:hypothetical protein